MPSGWRRRAERLVQGIRRQPLWGAVFFLGRDWRWNRLVRPPTAYFLPAAAKSMQKTPPKPRFWIPLRSNRWIFSRTRPKCRIVSASTVVSADSRPLRGRQSGHFLETASLHPPQAALRRFPAPLPLTVRNVGVCAPVGGPMPTSARNRKNCALLHFVHSAAAAQEQRRYYISCPLHGTRKRVVYAVTTSQCAGRA